MSCRSLTAVILFLFMALLPGCGRKTALVPPQKLVPEAINDLRYVLYENGASLKWSYPAKMENGDTLQAIESFELYRAEMPEEKYCEGCPVRFEEPEEIAGGRLPASGEGRTAVYTELNLQHGYRYLYKVRSRAGWWYPSSDSNIVTFVWHVPPKVPQGLHLEPGDRTVFLKWEPVAENIEGKPLGQAPIYQVYRRSGDADFAPIGEPVQQLELRDAGLVNNTLYTYQVRALVRYGDTLQAGGASREISVMPRDLTSPPPPQYLVIIVLPVGVKLTWQAVGTDDLAGYRIYRRQENSAVPDFVAEVGSQQNQYIDESVTGVGTWFYSVTAFDTAQPFNESLPGAEVMINLE